MLALVPFSLLGACHWTRPPQDNFTIHAGGSGIEPFIAALSKRFGRAEAQVYNPPESDPSQMFELRGQGAIVVVVPVPDDRCDPNAPMKSTYKQREYRIDLVYETSSSEKREAAKKLLIASATEAGRTLAPFKEC